MDRPDEEKGWRTSLSHPSKVDFEQLSDGTRLLANGVDTLVIGIDVIWKDGRFFKYLTEKKEQARAEDKDIEIELTDHRSVDAFRGVIKPFGMRGYEWVIVGKEYSFHIGNWNELKSMPSIKVEIRSEALWHIGPHEAVNRVISFIDGAGGKIHRTKASRVDLCVDLLFPSDIWTPDLARYRSTYARKSAIYLSNTDLEGITVGRGEIQARLYDKPMEIKEKGQKEWMFDVWKLENIPEGFNVVRTEFQIRREVLRELGIDSVEDMFQALGNIWAYCTEKWLKFQNNPGCHHTQRTTFEWWTLIQRAFDGENGDGQPGPVPLIRCKALCTEEKKHYTQTYGCFTSFLAASLEKDEEDDEATFYKGINRFIELTRSLEKSGACFREALAEKRTKIDRAQTKILQTVALRLRLGIPNNLAYVHLFS